jgi:hypothetical protein
MGDCPKIFTASSAGSGCQVHTDTIRGEAESGQGEVRLGFFQQNVLLLICDYVFETWSLLFYKTGRLTPGAHASISMASEAVGGPLTPALRLIRLLTVVLETKK